MFIIILIAIGYVLLASITSFALYINNTRELINDYVIMGLFFPIVWLFVLIKLPIIIYEKKYY